MRHAIAACLCTHLLSCLVTCSSNAATFTLTSTPIISASAPNLNSTSGISLNSPALVHEFSIFEELPIGSYVGTLLHNRLHPTNKHFSVLSQQPEVEYLLFGVEPLTGVVRTAGVVDRDALCPSTTGLDRCYWQFDVGVKDGDLLTFLRVKVEVMDVNDNAPLFPVELIEYEVWEGAGVGTAISVPGASDLDTVPLGIDRYDLHPPDSPFTLEVLPSPDTHPTLRLILRRPLDRETLPRLDLLIRAVDRGLPPLTGTLGIRVVVGDANDHGARFENSTYEVSVREDWGVREGGGVGEDWGVREMVLLRVRATDADEGENARITYALSERSAQEHGATFGVNPSTGDVFLRRALDRESKSLHLLSILTFDSGPDSVPDHATILIHVEDVNDNPPSISVESLDFGEDVNSLHIAENQDEKGVLAHVAVTDPDTGGKIECHVTDERFALERMYEGQFRLVTSSRFDRETEALVRVAVVCRDGGEPERTASYDVTVVVMDENDNSPRFRQEFYSASMRENNSPGDFVLTVEASDPDAGPNGRLEYKLDESAGRYLDIDARTGRISAAMVFDREQTREVNFFVFARDLGELVSRSSSARVRLTVLDVDDERPRFDSDRYVFSVREHDPPGTEVGHVVARDGDAAPFDRLSYSQQMALYGGRGDGWDRFTLDPSTGRIATREPLDREVQSVYHVTVRVHAHSDPLYTSSASVTIHILDLNDHRPLFTHPPSPHSTLTLSSLAPPGHVVIVLRAEDLDLLPPVGREEEENTPGEEILGAVEQNVKEINAYGRMFEEREVISEKADININEEKQIYHEDISVQKDRISERKRNAKREVVSRGDIITRKGVSLQSHLMQDPTRPASEKEANTKSEQVAQWESILKPLNSTSVPKIIPEAPYVPDTEHDPSIGHLAFTMSVEESPQSSSWSGMLALNPITGVLTVQSDLGQVTVDSVQLVLTVIDEGGLNSSVVLTVELRREAAYWSAVEYLKELLGGGDGTALATVVSMAAVAVVIVLSIVLICVVNRAREKKSGSGQRVSPDLIRCQEVAVGVSRAGASEENQTICEKERCVRAREGPAAGDREFNPRAASNCVESRDVKETGSTGRIESNVSSFHPRSPLPARFCDLDSIQSPTSSDPRHVTYSTVTRGRSQGQDRVAPWSVIPSRKTQPMEENASAKLAFSSAAMTSSKCAVCPTLTSSKLALNLPLVTSSRYTSNALSKRVISSSSSSAAISSGFDPKAISSTSKFVTASCAHNVVTSSKHAVRSTPCSPTSPLSVFSPKATIKFSGQRSHSYLSNRIGRSNAPATDPIGRRLGMSRPPCPTFQSAFREVGRELSLVSSKTANRGELS